MEITRPRTCNGNYIPRDLYCTPWEFCGEGAYWNLLFYCRGVLTVLKSIHPRRGKKNDHYYDSPGCSRLWPLSEVSHCSHEPETYIKYFSTFSEYLLFSEDLIWFDFWLPYCPMYYSGISIGPRSCLVLHCHSHNYAKTDFVVKSNQNWSLSNGWQNHYFSWWLYVTTLSHNSFCICCQREQTLMIERIKYEIWVWFGHHFF